MCNDCTIQLIQSRRRVKADQRNLCYSVPRQHAQPHGKYDFRMEQRSDTEVLENACVPSPTDMELKELEGAGENGPSKEEDTAVESVRRYSCGFRSWRPKWLQVFANAKFFMVLLCLNVLLQTAITSGFNTSVLSTLERRYRFGSTAASFIISVYEFTFLLSVTFVSYFGAKGHKPRWLGIGVIIQGIGALVFASPQFLLGKYEVGSNEELRLELCTDDQIYEPNCDAGNVLAYILLLFGSIGVGLGTAGLYTLGVSYLDDIFSPKYVPIALGIFFVVSITGPAIGFGLAGGLLSVYVDPWESTTLEESDPNWVGAWWLCYLVAGLLSFLIAVPILMFPRVLPNNHLIMEERRKKMAKTYTSKHGEEKHFSAQVKSFPTHLKKLFMNPTWVLTALGLSALFFSLDGLVAFGPKYLETQYQLTASMAGLIIGALVIPGAGLGVVTGTIIVYFLKSNGKKAALVHAIAVTLTILPVFGFFAYCPSSNIAGITAEYPTGPAEGGQLSSLCNSACNCTSTIFEPVCGADGVSYFSPCRAGCDNNGDSSMQEPQFVNCSCIAESFTNATAMFDEVLATADEGECDQQCNNLVPFLLAATAIIYTIFITHIPVITIQIRCVADEQRSLSLGLQQFIIRTLGSVPGPIVYGALVDSSCVFFQNECGRRGNCWVYDNRILALRVFGVAILGPLLDTILAFAAWALYPKSKLSEKSSLGEIEKTITNPSFDQKDNETVQFPAVTEEEKSNLEEPEVANLVSKPEQFPAVTEEEKSDLNEPEVADLVGETEQFPAVTEEGNSDLQESEVANLVSETEQFPAVTEDGNSGLQESEVANLVSETEQFSAVTEDGNSDLQESEVANLVSKTEQFPAVTEEGNSDLQESEVANPVSKTEQFSTMTEEGNSGLQESEVADLVSETEQFPAVTEEANGE